MPLLGTSLPSQDRSHAVCFSVAPNFVDIYSVILIHSGSCCPSDTNHIFQNTSGRGRQEMENTLLNCLGLEHSLNLSTHKPMGLLAQEDSTGRRYRQREGQQLMGGGGTASSHEFET